MTSYFVSDIHLKSTNERNGFIFLEFLEQLSRENPKTTELFLLGDIFDLWLSKHSVFVQRYEAFITALSKLRTLQMPIHFFEGNHDVHLDVFFQDQMGIEVYTQKKYFERDGLILRCEHGDYINPDDNVYHRWLEIMRSPLVEQMGHRIPGFVWDFAGQLGSKISRGKSSKQDIDMKEKLKVMLRTYALKVFQEKPYDILITGHIHIREDREISLDQSKATERFNKVRAINLGSWYDTPQVLRLSNTKIEWLKYENGIFKGP